MTQQIKSFNQRYAEELTRQLRLVYPNMSYETLRELVREECKKNFKNPPVTVEKQTVSLLQFINYIESKNPILSGFGTLYHQHKDLSSLLYVLIEDLGTLRKKAKNSKFDHVNDEDKTLYQMFDTIQLTYKLLMNSLYGATIESNSFFFNPYFGPAVTYTGVVIITTSLNIFEKFMSNNFHFRKFSDLTTYINNIINEDYNPYDYVDTGVEDEILLNYLCEKLDNCTEKFRDKIKIIISNLDEQNKLKIYLKNNIYETIDRSNKLQQLFKNILGNEIFLDPNEPPEEYMEDLTSMWETLDVIVHYDYLDFYRYENAEYGERKTILTVDTDSNFLYLYPFVEYCKNKFGIVDDDIRRMTTTNVIMYVLTSLIAKCFETLTRVAFRIEDPVQRKIIAMKNEFYYKRIMLTTSKKNYSGIVTMQEGNLLNPPKHDVKGLAIKKVSTNKNVRNFFTELLRDNILSSERIDVSEILGKYNELESEIRESLLSGNISYLIPGKVNSVDSYVNPYTQQTVRGTLVWNELYPDKQIVFPDKINFLKLKDISYEEVVNILDDKVNCISNEEKDRIMSVLEDIIYKDENMAKYGFKVICMPKSVREIPEWLIPFIDIRKMIENHMKSGFKLLESLQFNVLNYQVGDDKGETLSNIVSI